MTREAKIAAFQAAMVEHSQRLAQLAPGLAVGQTVRWFTRRGNPFGNGATFTVVRIDLDHNHVGGVVNHTDACYCRDRVEVEIANGLQPDGSANFRTRVPVSEIF